MPSPEKKLARQQRIIEQALRSAARLTGQSPADLVSKLPKPAFKAAVAAGTGETAYYDQPGRGAEYVQIGTKGATNTQELVDALTHEFIHATSKRPTTAAEAEHSPDWRYTEYEYSTEPDFSQGNKPKSGSEAEYQEFFKRHVGPVKAWPKAKSDLKERHEYTRGVHRGTKPAHPKLTGDNILDYLAKQRSDYAEALPSEASARAAAKQLQKKD